MPIVRANPEGAPALPQLITQVVLPRDADLVYFSGVVAWDESLKIVGADHGAQTAKAMENIDVLLASVGATREAIVKETLYVVDWKPDLLPLIFDSLRDPQTPPPASTLVGVATLGIPDALIEIEVVVAVAR